MAIIIRDPEIAALVADLQRLTGAPTEEQAIKAALAAHLRHWKRQQPVSQRIARARHLADAMGPNDPDFDMKQFTDQLWSDS